VKQHSINKTQKHNNLKNYNRMTKTFSINVARPLNTK